MNITEHAYKRYVQRTMDYNEDKDIMKYLSENKSTVEERINKLFDSSNLIYEGQFREHSTAEIYMNKHGWIFCVDKKKQRIITLYKIDLGLDEEFNRLYIDRMQEQLDTLNLALYNAKEECRSKKEILLAEKNELLAQRKLLNQQVELVNQHIQVIDHQIKFEEDRTQFAEYELHKKMETFICKKLY